MMNREFLVTSMEDGVGVIQLKHPEKKNTLGWELHEGIIEVLQEWEDDDAVLFIGNEEYFCAGWCLDILNKADSNDSRRFSDLALKLMRAIYDFGKPSVAAVAGVAPGYSMDVADMCDIAIASENAAFGATQIKYAMNGFYHRLMYRVAKQHPRRMYYAGDPITAEEVTVKGNFFQRVVREPWTKDFRAIYDGESHPSVLHFKRHTSFAGQKNG